jgi:hypothetical protein
MTLQRNLIAAMAGVVLALQTGMCFATDAAEGPAPDRSSGRVEPRPRDGERHGDMPRGRRDGDRAFDDKGIDGPPGEDKPRRHLRDMQLSAEEVTDALAILRDYQPDVAERITKWHAEQPEGAGQMIAARMPWIRRLIYVRRYDEERYQVMIADMKLDRECATLSQKVREGDNTLEPELRKKIAEHFETRQKLREMEVDRLEKRVTELRNQLAERRQVQKDLVEQRYGELVGKGPESKW